MGRYHPRLDHVRELAGQARCIPVYRQLTGDGLTPVSAFRKIARPAPSFLFESVIGGEKVGRFSFLGTEPFLRFEARGNRGHDHAQRRPGAARTLTSDDPFQRAPTARSSVIKAVHLPGLPRFIGGAVGYAAYDAVRYTERLPDAPPDDRGLPDLAFAFYDRMVVFDHIRKTVLVVAHAHLGAGRRCQGSLRTGLRAHRRAGRRGWPRRARPCRPATSTPTAPPALVPKSNFTREQYEAVVRHCQEYIKAGDIFQVVPSQRFEVETTGRPFDIYRVLRVVNPSPFLFYLPFGDFSLIGSSPEILVRVEDGIVTIRPLAGTRRRGRDEAEDQALAEELLADPKERAEHIMLVDLGRNDVGRVAELRGACS